LLPWRQELGLPRRPSPARDHDVQKSPTLAVVDRDSGNFDWARSSPRLDEQALARDGPAFAKQARRRTAPVAHQVAALILSAQHVPALPSEGLLGRDAGKFLGRSVPGDDGQVGLEGDQRVTRLKARCRWLAHAPELLTRRTRWNPRFFLIARAEYHVLKRRCRA